MAESFRDCAQRIGLSDEVESYLRGEMDVDDPALMDALGAKHLDAMNKEYQAQLQATALDQMHTRMDGYRDGKFDRKAARAYLVMDDMRTGSVGVEQQITAIEQKYMAKMDGILRTAEGAKFTEKIRQAGGTFDKKLGDNALRILKGQDVQDDLARTVANTWRNVAEDIRTAYNQAGGFIKKLDDWAVPQKHNPEAMLKAGKSEWVQRTGQLIDRSKMTDEVGNPMGNDKIEKLLQDIYDTITTNGANKIDVRTQSTGGGAKLGNKHRDHRVLHFEPENWLKYANAFGDDDVIGAMVQHVQGMSRDLGMLQAMGPNPETVFQSMRQRVITAEAMNPVKRNEGVNNLDNIWANMTGMDHAKSNQFAAEFGDGVRTFASLAKLGSALLSSIPDASYAALTTFYNGGNMWNWGKTFLNQQFGFVGGKRGMAARASKVQDAQRLGLMQHQVIQDFQGSYRYQDANITSLGRKVSNGFYKATLMTPWDNGNRTAFKMSFLDDLSSMPDNFSNIKGRQKKLMDRYGITSDDWAKIQSVKDGEFGDMINLTQLDDDLSRKFLGMIESEANIGVVKPTTRTTAITNQGQAAGTVGGELARYTFQWKSFPLAFGQTQMSRFANTIIGRHGDDAGFRLAYAALALSSLGTMGAISVQAKEIAKGRDPLKMRNASDMGKLFQQGLVQSGAGGLWYDTIFGVGATGQVAGQLLAPPALKMFDDLMGMGVFLDIDEAAVMTIEDQITNGLGRSAAAALNWVPGQSIWYARAAYYNMIQVPLTELAHPQTATMLENRASRTEFENENGRWMEPGFFEVRPLESPFSD